MKSKLNLFVILCALICLASCAPRVLLTVDKKYPPSTIAQNVLVVGLSEQAPASAIKIGTVKITDAGMTVNCGWDIVIAKAKLEASRAGGNAIKITSHIPPSAFGSSCDRITADILRIENPEDLNSINAKKVGAIDTTWNYAKIYVYRQGGPGFLVGYDLHLNDSVICRVKDNSCHEIIVSKPGQYKLWARTEARSEIPLKIEIGRTYYIKCSIQTGAFVGHPQVQLVDRLQGKEEYLSIEKKKKK